jgi:hypothetical protein
LNSDVIFAVKLELFDLEVESHAGEYNILSSKKCRGGHEKGCCSLMCLGVEKVLLHIIPECEVEMDVQGF